MSTPFITAIEANIVARLQAQIAYLSSAQGGTVRGVADVQTATQLDLIPPPAVLAQFASEDASAPMHIGTPSEQMSRMRFDLFCIARSFSTTGEGRVDSVALQTIGAYTILDDVFAALEGYQLPSITNEASKLFYVGAARYGIDDARVIYVSRWYCSTLRRGV